MLKTLRLSLSRTTLVHSVRFTSTTVKPKAYQDIPGPAQIPIIGSSWKYYPVIGEFDVAKLGTSALTLYERYGPIVRERGGPVDVVHLYDPRDFETVHKLCHQTGLHLRRSFDALKSYRESKPHLYNTLGLFPAQGETWWNARRTTQKPVSPTKAVKNYRSQDDEIVKEFVAKIIQMGTVQNYISFGNRLNMELTLMFLFGERNHCFDFPQTNADSAQSELLSNITDFFDDVTYLDQSKFYWSFPSIKDYKNLNKRMEFVEKFVLEQIEKVKRRNNPEDNCIVAHLLRDPELHRADLGSIIDILYAGVDTTALISTSLLYELGMNKRVQDIMREEATRLLPRGRESEITEETLNQAVYLKAALRENFRLSPIVSLQNRQLPESVELSGYLVPKDTLVFLELFASCRLESNFKDPLVFKPERWLKSSEEFEKSHPYATLHFGLGLRTCIARRRAEQILHIILLRILSEYEVSHNGEEMERITPFLLKPAKPVNLTFTKIN